MMSEMGIYRQSSTVLTLSSKADDIRESCQRYSSASERNQNTTIPTPQARARQRNGWGRQTPQTATKTAAREAHTPNCRATSNEPAYNGDTNANSMDDVARTNPARDTVEETVRGCLARAHRIQLKMITVSQGPHTSRVTPIVLAGVSTGLTLLPESATFLLTQVTKAGDYTQNS